MSDRRVVLVAERDSGLVRSLQILLEDEGGYEVVVTDSVAAAVAAIEELGSVAGVLSDLPVLGHEATGLVEAVHRRWPELPLLLLTLHPSITHGVHPLAGGAVTLVGMPIDPEALLAGLAGQDRATLDTR